MHLRITAGTLLLALIAAGCGSTADDDAATGGAGAQAGATGKGGGSASGSGATGGSAGTGAGAPAGAPGSGGGVMMGAGGSGGSGAGQAGGAAGKTAMDSGAGGMPMGGTGAFGMGGMAFGGAPGGGEGGGSAGMLMGMGGRGMGGRGMGGRGMGGMSGMSTMPGGAGGTPASGGMAGMGACPASGHVSYTLTKSANPTADEQAAYDLIIPAMDKAVGYYNCYTNITKADTVTYVPSVDTADGSSNGSIRFGHKEYMEYITAMHEIAHTVGVGTDPKWGSLVVNGIFTGTAATTQLRAITGIADDQLHADTQHFWPYGLNYTSEVKSEADVIDHCLMVVAIRKDMGHDP